MPRTVAQVRLDHGAHSRFVAFVEGEPDGYTDDESGGLIGTGASSWIGLSETAIGGNEVVGTRRIRPGLIAPPAVNYALDPKTGALQPSPLTIEILDVDDTLSYLFASEGKDSVQLDQYIPPGTTALGVSVDIVGALTTNPRGRYIDGERIGPTGQRRFCPAIPFTLVGPDYAVGPNMPAVLISDEPVTFAGRMVTIYRIYKVRPELDDADPDAWALWDDAHDAGDLVFCGIIRDAGNISGGDVYALDCHGIDALTRRTLGTRTTGEWLSLVAEPATVAAERPVAIGFMSHASASAAPDIADGDWGQPFIAEQFFDSAVFNESAHTFTGTTREEIADELNGWIADVLGGTDTNVSHSGGPFDTWTDTTNPNPSAGVSSQGTFFVKREADTSDELEWGGLLVCMHRDYWQLLGWEPWRQHVDGSVFGKSPVGGSSAEFREFQSGEELRFRGWTTGELVPGSGYWLGRFTTVRSGEDQNGVTPVGYDNDGQPREWLPMHAKAVFVLRPDGAQVVRLNSAAPEDVYIEGQPTAGIESASNEIDGAPVELGRWFVIRGDHVTIRDDVATEDEVELSEVQKIHLVCKGEWIEGASHGLVSEGSGTGVSPALRISHYEYPRAWGWNNNRWIYLAGKTSGKGTIEIAPLHAYHYQRKNTKPFEVAASVWLQVMLSTGTADGYDAPHDEGGTFTGGDNQTVTPGLDFQDCELADMGLGVPQQLVASPSDVYAAFDTVPGGATGALNRVRMGYVGPYQAQDVLDSLMRPRRLCWSLHGKRLGLFALGPVSPEDVDIVITEDDLAGEPNQPTSVIPVQSFNVAGQLDRVDLSYRWDADTGKTALAHKFPALDAGARKRTGELVEEMNEHGLCPPWFGTDRELRTGVGNWEELFREHWSRDAAEFFAKRHYSLELSLARPLGQDAMPGSSVAVTNQWPVNPRGGRGITSATGRVLRATHLLREDRTVVECMIFAGGPVVHYSPAVLIGRVDGTEVEWYDYTGIDADGRGFVEPEWSETGGEMQVDFYQRFGTAWTLVFSCGVVSVDIDNRTAILDAAPGSAILRDKDTWMVARSWSNQNANEWPREVYGAQADTDQTVGDGTTKASPFVG